MGSYQSCPERNDNTKQVLAQCYVKERRVMNGCQTFAFCNKKAREELAKMPKEKDLLVYSTESTKYILFIFFFAFLSFCIYLSLFYFNKKNNTKKNKSDELSVDEVSQINPQVKKNESNESDLLIV
jgi:hypothetical protein